MEVKISQPKVTQTTEFLFIKSSSVTFTITTQPMKWEVLRSENDFYALRKILALSFPHYIVPPLPSKLEYKFTQRSLEKRMRYFNRFLNAVCRNQIFCSYQILVEFLMIKHNNAKTFQDKMKNEETQLLKQRNPLKPEMQEIQSIYPQISTKLKPESAQLNFPQYIENYESVLL